MQSLDYTYHTLGTACLHLMGVKLRHLCDNPVSLRTREGIFNAIRMFQDTSPGYKTRTPEEILRKAINLLREARKKGFEYVPLATTSTFLQPYNETMDTFPGIFIGTCDMDALRESLQRHTVAVIGTRDCDARGLTYTANIIEKMKNSTLVTGFAFGISAAAIINAMKEQMPVIAISAVGAGSVYPSRMQYFHERLTQTPGCAVVTPYFPGTEPLTINFLLRNHLVALTDETIVIESKDKGGALVTARRAAAFGRHVDAVPGRPDDIRSKGCNQLIKEGTAGLLLEI